MKNGKCGKINHLNSLLWPAWREWRESQSQRDYGNYRLHVTLPPRRAEAPIFVNLLSVPKHIPENGLTLQDVSLLVYPSLQGVPRQHMLKCLPVIMLSITVFQKGFLFLCSYKCKSLHVLCCSLATINKTYGKRKYLQKQEGKVRRSSCPHTPSLSQPSV